MMDKHIPDWVVKVMLFAFVAMLILNVLLLLGVIRP